MGICRAIGNASGRAKENVLAFTQADLADCSDQLHVDRQAEFSMHVSGRRSGVELGKVDAVVQDADLVGFQPVRQVKLARGVRDGQETCVAVHIGRGLGAELDDVTHMAEACQSQFGCHRARQSAHGQAVGVQERRPALLQDLRQWLAQLALRQAAAIGPAAGKRQQLDAEGGQGVGQRPFGRADNHRREAGFPNAVQSGQHRAFAAVERGIFTEEADFRHGIRLIGSVLGSELPSPCCASSSTGRSVPRSCGVSPLRRR
jgi:hypothetical protein